MRVILGFILFTSSTFALSTAKFAQDLTEKLLDATKVICACAFTINNKGGSLLSS
jgi:hypothetical protein